MPDEQAPLAEQGADGDHIPAAEAVVIGIVGAFGFARVRAGAGGGFPRLVFTAILALPGALFFGPDSHGKY
jgi:hypothetical protein